MFLTNTVLYKFNVHIAIASLESGNKQNQKKVGGVVYEAYKGIYSGIWVIGNLIMANTIWVHVKRDMVLCDGK